MPSNSPKLKKDVIAMRETWRKHPDYNCFWSSPDNERGLRLTPTVEPGRVYVELKIESFHSGFPGIAHGGVAFTILDGMMSWYLMSHLGRGGFTKGASVKYNKPLHVGQTYRFEVKISEKQKEGNLIALQGDVYRQDDTASKQSLLTMNAAFVLANSQLAKAVLGVDLGPMGLDIFPDE